MPRTSTLNFGKPLRRIASLCLGALFGALLGCSSSPLSGLAGAGAGAGAGAAESGGDAGLESAAAGAAASEAGSELSRFMVFDHIPQFGVYSETDPSYAAPDGVLLWKHGTEFVTRLSPEQQAQLVSKLSLRVTYFAQCDPYDRLGGVFFLLEPKGQAPAPDDPRVELVRFVTPFSDYRRLALATHIYPDVDISAYAAVLADSSRDVWIGIAGGSNPYDGDACRDDSGTLSAGVSADFAAVGFSYSVEFVSQAGTGIAPAPGLTLGAKSNSFETSTPIDATFLNEGDEVEGQISVIVSGHGSAAGGAEYRYTQDTLSLNDERLGSFNTRVDCAEYAAFSPDGNPAIFQGNSTLSNPRNWCPGALLPAHSFAATLKPGMNSVRLAVAPSTVPEGSGYATSISFSAR